MSGSIITKQKTQIQTQKKIRHHRYEDTKMKENYDVIIVGTGAAGLYCALNLPERTNILMITKQEADWGRFFSHRAVFACWCRRRRL